MRPFERGFNKSPEKQNQSPLPEQKSASRDFTILPPKKRWLMGFQGDRHGESSTDHAKQRPIRDFIRHAADHQAQVSSQRLGAEKTHHPDEPRLEAPSLPDNQRSQATLSQNIEKIPAQGEASRPQDLASSERPPVALWRGSQEAQRTVENTASNPWWQASQSQEVRRQIAPPEQPLPDDASRL